MKKFELFQLFSISETASPVFDEFLDLLGQRVRLKGFDKYRAQLDNKCESPAAGFPTWHSLMLFFFFIFSSFFSFFPHFFPHFFFSFFLIFSHFFLILFLIFSSFFLVFSSFFSSFFLIFSLFFSSFFSSFFFPCFVNWIWMCIPADSTGAYSLYTAFHGYQIMFHVSTMLPFTPSNKQQVLFRTVIRSYVRRVVGNAIVIFLLPLFTISYYGNVTSGTTLWRLCSRTPALCPSPRKPSDPTFSTCLSWSACRIPTLTTPNTRTPHYGKCFSF